nr:hypothetical protein [Burkholderia stagnalis]
MEATDPLPCVAERHVWPLDLIDQVSSMAQKRNQPVGPAKFVASAPDRFAAHHDTALEQQFFDIAQAELEAEIHRVA